MGRGPIVPWIGARLAAALLLVGVGCVANGAPSFVAAHGFSRPVQVATPPASTRAALAFDDGAPYVYWYDADGTLRARPEEPIDPERVSEARGIRDLAAVSAAGAPAVLRVTRDFGTGQNAHVIAWRGERRTVATSLQVLPVALAAAPTGPGWAIRRGGPSGSALEVAGWTREPALVRATDESLAGYDVIAADDGGWWVSWLEGTTDQTALGSFSDWRAYVAHVAPDGRVREPVELGGAVHRGRVDLTRLAAGGDRTVHVLWPRDDGFVVATTLSPDAEPAPAVGEGRVDRVLGPGIAIGVWDGFAYWANGDRIRRLRLEPGTTEQNVLWAPNVIEGATGGIGPDGVLWLAWFGGTLRGGSAVYAAGTADPFVPGPVGRIAAWMGWNPWDVWTEALGQLLASLLAGTLLAMALTPLLWIGAALAVRFGRVGTGVVAGIAIGGGVVAASLLAVRLRLVLPPDMVTSLFGTWWQVAIALGAGATATWLFRRRKDAEPLLGTLIAASACAGIAIAVLSFLTFQAWSESWGRIL